jgi:dTDP-4-amino-4,6-dideoxygalactose transaminase
MSSDNRNKIDELAASNNIVVIEQFDPDGSGVATAYRGKQCGRITHITKFS